MYIVLAVDSTPWPPEARESPVLFLLSRSIDATVELSLKSCLDASTHQHKSSSQRSKMGLLEQRMKVDLFLALRENAETTCLLNETCKDLCTLKCIMVDVGGGVVIKINEETNQCFIVPKQGCHEYSYHKCKWVYL